MREKKRERGGGETNIRNRRNSWKICGKIQVSMLQSNLRNNDGRRCIERTKIREMVKIIARTRTDAKGTGVDEGYKGRLVGGP